MKLILFLSILNAVIFGLLPACSHRRPANEHLMLEFKVGCVYFIHPENQNIMVEYCQRPSESSDGPIKQAI